MNKTDTNEDSYQGKQEHQYEFPSTSNQANDSSESINFNIQSWLVDDNDEYEKSDKKTHHQPLPDETKFRMLNIMLDNCYRCITDPADRDYKNRHARGIAIEKLYQQLIKEGYSLHSARQLQYIYNNLVTSYNRIVKRLTMGVNIQDFEDNPWPFFTLMHEHRKNSVEGTLIQNNDIVAENWTDPPHPSQAVPSSSSSQPRIVKEENVRDQSDRDKDHFEVYKIFGTNRAESCSTSTSSVLLPDSPIPHSTLTNNKQRKRKAEELAPKDSTPASASADTTTGNSELKRGKTNADLLAATLATTCAEMESKKPGSSKIICVEMAKLVARATTALYEL